MFVIGLGTGVYVGHSIVGSDFDIAAPWPPELAVGLAALYLITFALGTMLLDKSIDELERLRTYKAITFAGTAYMAAYPVWFLLWKAQLVIESVNWLLFVAFSCLLVGSAIHYRFR